MNRGHGHVNPRPDGVRARCGGPGICAECSHEQAMAIKGDADIKALREENAKLQSEAGNLREAFDEIAHLRKEIERLKAEVKKLESECPGCGQIADGWGFCDCAHDFKKEKSGQLRELFSEAVKVIEFYAKGLYQSESDVTCINHADTPDNNGHSGWSCVEWDDGIKAREFLAKVKP